MARIKVTQYIPNMVPLKKIEEAAYNPRKRMPERMEFLRMSIRKLGFLLPLYATPTGHLLSGHQRSQVARELGCRHIPVVEVEGLKEDRLKQLNIVFNRATNDMGAEDTSENLFDKLQASGIDDVLDKVRDKDPLGDDFYRCKSPEMLKTLDVVTKVERAYHAGSVAFCKQLLKEGIVMPVVMTHDLSRVINGQYRLLAAAEMFGDGEELLEYYPVVRVSEEEAAVSELLLNMISMKFTIEDQHADMIRYGAYRAQRIDRNLVQSLRFFADNYKAVSATVSLEKPKEFWHKWRKEHGETVLDFGAGRRHNLPVLQKKGVKCVEFEPYPVPWEDQYKGKVNMVVPSIDLSRKLAEWTCDEVRDGTKFDSIFLPAVINSIPFFPDRMKVLAVIHAICHFDTRFYGSTRSLEGKKMNPMTKLFGHDGRPTAPGGMFEVPYENDVVLGDISNDPKIQKFMGVAELRAMLEVFWKKVEIWENKGAYHYYRCSHPKRVNFTLLAQALVFEFDLPYPGGSVDRYEYALDAFSHRHKVDLRSYLPAGWQEEKAAYHESQRKDAKEPGKVGF